MQIGRQVPNPNSIVGEQRRCMLNIKTKLSSFIAEADTLSLDLSGVLRCEERTLRSSGAYSEFGVRSPHRDRCRPQAKYKDPPTNVCFHINRRTHGVASVNRDCALETTHPPYSL